MDILRSPRNQLLYVLYPKVRSLFSTPVLIFKKSREENNLSVVILGKTFFGNYEGFENRLNSLRKITYSPNMTICGRKVSDAGWGCVVRGGQMLLLNILTVKLKVDFSEMIPLFVDRDDFPGLNFGSFLCEAMSNFNLREGDFWNFKQFFLCVEKLWTNARSRNEKLPGLRIVLHDDCALSKETVEEFLKKDCILLVFNVIIRDPAIRSKALCEFFSLRQFGGCLGAVSTRCFYFFGIEEDKGLLMDPHELREQKEVQDFEMESVESMPFSKMDESLSLTFLVENLGDLEAVLTTLRRQVGTEIVPLWTLSQNEETLEVIDHLEDSQEFYSTSETNQDDLADLD